MKQTKLWLTTMVALLCSLTVSAHDFEVDGIYYNIISEEELKVEVTFRGVHLDDYFDEYSGEITIPSTVIHDNKTYSVTSIGNQAFYCCGHLSSIRIPKEAIDIGYYTFCKCNELISVIIPSDSELEIIGDGAFSGCSALKSIVIPEGVTKIGKNAFEKCSALISINIPESVTRIDHYAFSGCSQLTDIHIGSIESWLSIGFGYETAHPNYAGSAKNLYVDNKLLTEVDIPSTIKSIHSYAFQGCESITSINIPESATSIGYDAFRGCSNLISITIPEGVTSIGGYAFSGCSSLTSVNFSEESNLTSIPEGAFKNCSSLTSINIPKSVTEIGQHAFLGCSQLTSVILPESITNIKDGTFDGCNSLTFINIPKSVEWIGSYAFYGCGSLTNIHIGSVESWLKIRYVSDATSYPENRSSHPNYLSSNVSLYVEDTLLTEVDIPSTITSVPNYAFKGCCNITSVNIPESVTEIGNGAFMDCSSLSSVKIPENSSWTTLGKETFRSCSSLPSINIPEGVTSIEERMFQGCKSLTSVVLPEGVTSIGDSAFDVCSSLTSITIPDSVERIGNSAFFSCSNLTTVNISGNSKLTNIADYAFSYCSNLTSFTIPKNIDRIGTYAFRDCSRLYTIINYSDKYISAGSHNYGDLSFYAKRVLNGNSLVTIGDFQFRTSGNTHYLANYIGSDEGIILPDSYNNENYRIDAYAFYYNDIKSLTISSGVLSIGEKAFNNPRKVIWLTNTPPSGYTYAKGNINYVANDQYEDLNNVKVYPYLSSMFEMDGVKYVPISPSERTCHAIDCVYDSTMAIVKVGETASYKGVEMTVKEIMPYAFYGNSYIKNVSVSHAGNIGDCAFYNCDSVQSIAVSNLGYIGNQAFYDCDGIITADIYNQGKINSQAFYGCDEIRVVDLSNKDFVGEKSFSSCLKLSDIVLRDGITEIKNEAFAFCESLESIEIPSTVSKLGQKIFYACNALSAIVVSDANVTYDSRDNCNAIIERDNNNLIVGCNGTIIPKSVTSIGNYAFYGCEKLSNVILNENITTLGANAFNECKNLKEIIIPNSVTSVGSYCFSNCSAMNRVLIEDGVASIDDHAFYNCAALTEITLPKTVMEVGNYVFRGCSELSNVIIENRTAPLSLGSNGSASLFANCPLDSVYIGGKITYNTSSSKGYSPFYRNTSLRTVVIADKAEQILGYEFYGCTALKSVAIGNGVKSIGDYAFSGCSNLDDFSFGSSMETIGVEAFSDCTNLTTITSYSIIPPTCGAQALDDINKWSCTLRVPSGYATSYQDAGQWKEFFFVEDVVEVKKYALTFIIDGEVYYTDTLAHRENIPYVSKPYKNGYTFSGWDKTFTKMPAEDVVINGTFTINTYRVYYVVDGITYHTDEIAYGDTIVLAEEPTKEGYTFSGWSGAPETMPAYNLDIRGAFIANKYFITFKIGDEVIAADSLEYGTAIVAPEVPEREGYTFDGWEGIAETVPAEDVTYYGSYSVNSYLLTYVVDGETIQSDSVAYGTAIVALEEPTKEGYTFSGWSDVPATMPAEELVVSGFFTVNIYKVYYYVGDALVHTAEVAYGEAIPEYVYEPTAEGDVFVGWVGETYETMPAHDVTYRANITNEIEEVEFRIQNSEFIYDLTGRRIINTEKLKGVYIVNGKKVMLQ